MRRSEAEGRFGEAEPEGCASIRAEWRRAENRRAPVPTARPTAPFSGTQRCEMHRTGKRPPPNAISRLRSGAGAMRNGAFRAQVPLGRWTAHADWHRTHSTHDKHMTPHARKNARLMPHVRNSLASLRSVAQWCVALGRDGGVIASPMVVSLGFEFY